MLIDLSYDIVIDKHDVKSWYKSFFPFGINIFINIVIYYSNYLWCIYRLDVLTLYYSNYLLF